MERRKKKCRVVKPGNKDSSCDFKFCNLKLLLIDNKSQALLFLPRQFYGQNKKSTNMFDILFQLL